MIHILSLFFLCPSAFLSVHLSSDDSHGWLFLFVFCFEGIDSVCLTVSRLCGQVVTCNDSSRGSIKEEPSVVK